ncbi:MAG: oligosaccharide flippase family protein [Flammeovirgaceae bacterium]|nr:MAG: oligosaccharide flippase family protein [Flammeovirgaceae bacterium]
MLPNPFLLVKNIFSRLFPEGRFIHNLAVTFTGNATALVLGLVFTPFIARLYGPAAYGAFALFMAIVNNVSPLVTLQYPTGYVTIKDDDEFYKLVQFTFGVIIFFVALSGLVIFSAGKYLVVFFEWEAIEAYLWFIPLYLLLIGLDNLLLGWGIRLKEFKRSALGKIVSTSASKLVTLLVGLFVRTDASGLITGNALQYPLDSLARMGGAMRNQFHRLNRFISFADIRRLWKAYKAYPFFITTGLLLSNFSNQLPVYIISFYFGQTTLGLFALAFSLVSMPMNVLISSSTTVFLQKAAELHPDYPEQLSLISLQLYKKLFLLGITSLTALSLISLPLFVFLFGEPWRESGIFAAILAFSFIPGVAANPLSVLFRVLHKEHSNFILNMVFIVLKAAGLLAGAMTASAQAAIMGYVLATILGYIIQLYVIFGMVKLNRGIVLRDGLITLALFGGVTAFFTFV